MKTTVQTEPQEIWDTTHSWGDWGESDDVFFAEKNILSQPENIKAIIVYFANKTFYKEKEKEKLAKLLGFSTIEIANQTLSKKWITDANLPKKIMVGETLSVLRKDDKVLFYTGSRGGDDIIIVFEVNKDRKMIFAEQYNPREMNRTESQTDRQIRLKYELSSFATNDSGVVINGLHWATRNVGSTGTFVPKIEDFGKHYQFNSNIGWDEFSNADEWILRGMVNNTWEKENDPCPKGWRIPTTEDFETLLDTAKVDYGWVNQNNVRGVKFTDKSTKKSLFLPYANYRNWEDGRLGSGDGYYWSNRQSEPRTTDCKDSPMCRYMIFLYLDSPNRVSLSRFMPYFGLSVRCVTE